VLRCFAVSCEALQSPPRGNDDEIGMLCDCIRFVAHPATSGMLLQRLSDCAAPLPAFKFRVLFWMDAVVGNTPYISLL